MDFLQQVIGVVESMPTPVRRSLSSILAEFPWLTSNIVQTPQPLLSSDIEKEEYHLFFKALDSFERNLFQFQRNDDSVSTLRLLGVALPADPPTGSTTCIISQHEHVLTAADYHRIGSIVAAYRFYEVLGLRSGRLERIPKDIGTLSMFLPDVQRCATDLHYYNYLLDWPKTIDDFCTLAKKSVKSPIPPKNYSIPLMSLLKMMEDNSGQKNFLAICENFLYMAIQVASFKQVPFKSGTLPDLPSTFSHLDAKYRGRREYDDLVQAYTTFLQTDSADSSMGTAPIAFRNSFHLAVLISPLYLLAPSRLSKKSFNRRTILDIASRLGRNTPPIIDELNNLVLDSVFKLSEGNTEVGNVLRELATSFTKVDFLNGRTPDDNKWFKVPPPTRYVRINQNALVKTDRSTNVSNYMTTSPSALPSQSAEGYVIPNLSSLHSRQSPLSPNFMPNPDISSLSTPFLKPVPPDPVRLSETPQIEKNAMDIGPVLHLSPNADVLASGPSTVPPIPSRVVDGNTNMTSEGGGDSGDTALHDTMPAVTSHSTATNATNSNDTNNFLDSLFLPPEPSSSEQPIGNTASPFVDGDLDPVEDDFPEVSGGHATSPSRFESMHNVSSTSTTEGSGETPVDFGHDFDLDVDMNDTDIPIFTGDNFEDDLSSPTKNPEKQMDRGSPLTPIDDDSSPSSTLPTMTRSSPSPTQQTPSSTTTTPNNTNLFELLNPRKPTSLKNKTSGNESSSDESSSDESSAAKPSQQPDTQSFRVVRDTDDAAIPLVGDSSAPVATSTTAAKTDTSNKSASTKAPPGSKSKSQKPPSKPKKPVKSASQVPSDTDEDKPSDELKNTASVSQPAPLRSGKRPLSEISTLGTASNPITINNISSIFDPVSVFDFVEEEKPNIPEGVRKQIPGKKKYTLFDSKGGPLSFTPRFHYEEQLNLFDTFMESSNENIRNGKPLHIVDRGASIIATFTYREWMSLEPPERLYYLSTKNVVVSNWPIDDQVSFDKDGLRKVAGRPCRQISIQDYTISPDDDNGITVSGHVQDILDNLGPNGKILNALDLPMFQADTKLTEHSSDLHAWDITRGIHRISQKSIYPAEHMRWALVGLKNTMSNSHVDCDGLSSFVHVLCGGKVWGFLRERPTNPVASTNFFLNGFELDSAPSSDLFTYESIVLRAGDRLHMLPGQPHFVYGFDDTLCYGGHFYNTHQMRMTFHGLIHTSMLQFFLTNTTHPTQGILRCMVIFFHMGLIEKLVEADDPAYLHLSNLQNMDGIMNLICTCVLVILGNVLDHRTYQAPNAEELRDDHQELGRILLDSGINTIHPCERLAACYARGVALRLLQWVRDCCTISNHNFKVVNDFPTFFLEQTIQCLENYLEKIISKKQIENSPFTPEQFTAEISNIRSIYKGSWQVPTTVDNTFLGLKEIERYHFNWTSEKDTWDSGDTDFLAAGTTPFDMKFFQAQEHRLQHEKDVVLRGLHETYDMEGPPAKRAKRG